MNRFVIQEGPSGDVFAAVKQQWNDLYAESDCSPFSSWEWTSTWFRHFGEGRSPVILCVHRGSDLIAILPLFREKKRFAGMRINRLGMIGEGIGGADHLDIISRPEDRLDAIESILEYLSESESCETVAFENLDGGSVTLETLRKHTRKSDMRYIRSSESVVAVCPQIDLAAGWEAVLSESRRCDNFKRKLKKLAKMPGFEFRSVTSPSETSPAFDRFLHLHEKRWANSGGSELSGHPRLISFQRQIVGELAAAGMIRFDELWLDGECRSSIYGLDSGCTFYYYNSGYDLDFGNLSVGLVLLGLSIEAAVERGATLYDFLRGDETYKADWANRRTELVNMRLSLGTPAVIAYEAFGHGVERFKRAAKRLVPSSLTEPLANWRRSWNRNHQLSGR